MDGAGYRRDERGAVGFVGVGVSGRGRQGIGGIDMLQAAHDIVAVTGCVEGGPCVL